MDDEYYSLEPTEFNDFCIVQGQKFCFSTYLRKDGVIIPFTGLKARMTVAYKDTGEFGLSLTTENGGVTIVDGKLIIVAKSAETTLLKVNPAMYELELIDSTGDVIGFLGGDIKIQRGILQ